MQSLGSPRRQKARHGIDGRGRRSAETRRTRVKLGRVKQPLGEGDATAAAGQLVVGRRMRRDRCPCVCRLTRYWLYRPLTGDAMPWATSKTNPTSRPSWG